MYADYTYYTNDFGGTLIPEDMFDRSVKMAGRYIDMFTYGNITEDNTDTIDGLKDCACDMAESVYSMLYASTSEGQSKEKKSETIDGYSVTYVTDQKDGESVRKVLERNLYAIVSLYLGRSGLMFAGVKCHVDKCKCDII